MKAIRKLFFVLGNFRLLREMVAMMEYGYLKDSGWLKSVDNPPQDAEGNAIPWLTLPFIHFVEERLTKDLRLLEFGSGNSTIYFGTRVKEVVSIEHVESWVASVSPKLGPNCQLLLVPLDAGYEKSASIQKLPFDIILVDGRKRVECIKNSYSHLTTRGVLILDNSDREEYAEGISFLLDKGFKKIDFFGLSPGHVESNCTTLFYRPDNCLKI